MPLLGLAIATLHLRYQEDQYKVSATLLIKDKESDATLTETVILKELDVFPHMKNLENEIQILKSRTLMEEVVHLLQLNTTYYWQGRVRSTQLYKTSPIIVDSFQLNPHAYGTFFELRAINNTTLRFGIDDDNTEYPFNTSFQNEHGTFRLLYTPTSYSHGKPMLIHFSTVAGTAQYYSDKLSVRPIGNSNVLEISLMDPVPNKGEDIINTLIAVYNQAAIDDKNKVGKNTLEFIDERLVYLTQDLSAVESGVEKYKRENEIASNLDASSGTLLSQLSEFEAQLIALEVEERILQSMQEYMLRSENQYELLPANLKNDDPVLANQIQELNSALLEREALLRNATEKNPAVANMNNRIIRLRQNVMDNIASVQKNLKTEINAVKINKELIVSKVRSVPKKERELLEYQRQQSIKENLYLYLLQKREETALSLAVAVASSRTIDPAKSSGPIRTNRFSLYAIAVFAGLMLAATLDCSPRNAQRLHSH